MINLKTLLIMEANQKRPSGLGKIKDKSEEKNVTFIAGDIYDLSDSNRYTDKFKYYKGEGNGYITDKEGNVYDVNTSTSQGDAGRIAGGSTSVYVTIKNVKGTDIHFSGYRAIFSSSHGMDIISDIEAGMYLEDYLAKHWNDMSGNNPPKHIVELKEKGNATAKTYKQQKEESKAEKISKFWERYFVFNHDLNVDIKNDAIHMNDMYFFYPNGRSVSDKEITDKEKELKMQLKEKITQIVSKLLKEKFNCEIAEMNGLHINLIPTITTTTKWSSYKEKLAFDTKKNKFVAVDKETAKVIDSKECKLVFGPTVTLIKKDASEKMCALFMQAANEYQRINKRKKTEWINANWESIWQSGRGMYPWNSDKFTKGQAKKMAEKDWKEDLDKHSWNYSKGSLTFLTEFISQFITAPEEIEKITGEEVINDPEETKQRGKNTVMGKGARAKQEAKMDAWHKGERKQNVANCSDAKLKMNYEICKEKGYEKEAAALKAEATKRGLVFESIEYYI